MSANRLITALGVLLICGMSLADQPADLPDPESSTVWENYGAEGSSEMLLIDDHPAQQGHGCVCGDCCCNTAGSAGGPYGGVDFLLVRTHFSEAIAFATGTVVAPDPSFTVQMQARELDFGYRPSFRAFLGYHLSPITDLQLTYWRLDTNVDVNGFAALPNQFIIDPFGNQANPGDSVFTNAEVNLNVFDFDLIRAMAVDQSRLTLQYFAGLRIADVQQSYTSFIANPREVRSVGTFAADFIGLGPHLGLQGAIRGRRDSPFALLAKGGAALLVGDYDINSSSFVFGRGGRQIADRTRMVSVLEAELGATWQPSQALSLSGGWLFQSWSNIGTSGGSFGGTFVQTDDSDIMSFDGLFLRGQVNF